MWTTQLVKEVNRKFGEFSTARKIEKFDFNVLDIGNLSPSVFVVVSNPDYSGTWTFEIHIEHKAVQKPTATVKSWYAFNGECIDPMPDKMYSMVMTREDLKLYAASEAIVEFFTKLLF